MNKGVKFRIYPNKEQEKKIMQTLGCCRLVYNMGLDIRNAAYQNGEKANYAYTCKMITLLKHTNDFSFLNDADSVALQQSLKDLDMAFQKYFTKKAEAPRLKSKHEYYQSYRTMNRRNKTTIRLVGKYLKLPKLGYVKVKQSMEVGIINNVTVVRTKTGKYFAVLNVTFNPEQRQNGGKSIGIDVGIENFYTNSNGIKVDNPRYLEKHEQKLKREQRRLARKQKGSNNRNKQRLRVARAYEKVTNQRNDFLQKESTKLVRENQTICIEDLYISKMLCKHRLSKQISSAAWGKFFLMLEYKAAWYGNTIVKVPRFFPSSQICSKCGRTNTLIKNLSIREWECPNCHASHDRDHNAAINILNKGLSLI